MKLEEVVAQLNNLKDEQNRQGQARYGINIDKSLGVRIPDLRKLAKAIGKDHQLAAALWKGGLHEGRILAGMIDDPAQVTQNQMEAWVLEFDSWDVCDQVCMNLFDKTPFAYDKALEWADRHDEFVRRAGFAMMACLAVHDKEASDKQFAPFFVSMEKHCTDERNFVKKAVNWALRQVGKRNPALHKRALATARKIENLDNKAAKWVAKGAIRELTDPKQLGRLGL